MIKLIYDLNLIKINMEYDFSRKHYFSLSTLKIHYNIIFNFAISSFFSVNVSIILTHFMF